MGDWGENFKRLEALLQGKDIEIDPSGSVMVGGQPELYTPNTGPSILEQVQPFFNAPENPPGNYPTTTALEPNEAAGETGAVGSSAPLAQSSIETMAGQLRGEANAHMERYSKLMDKLNQSQEPASGLSGPATLIPALMGLAGGALIGSPKLSPHARIPTDDLAQNMTGWGAGLAQGAAYGTKMSDQYIRELEQQRMLQQKYQYEQAQNELDQGTRAGNQAWQMQSQQASAEEASKRSIRNAVATEQAMQDANLKETVEQKQAKSAAYANRAETAKNYLELAQKKYDLQIATKKIPGYVISPTYQITDKDASEIKGKLGGLIRMKTLMQQALKTPDVLTGADAQTQEALYGMMMNAGRMQTNSGAAFSATEQGFISKGVLISKAADLTEYMRRTLLGRTGKDREAFVDDITNIMQKVNDYELAEGYSLFNERMPAKYYPDYLQQSYQETLGGAQGGSAKSKFLDALTAQIQGG